MGNKSFQPSLYQRLPHGYRILTGLSGAAALVIAVTAALEKGVGGDFHVFWEAGQDFWTGKPLYAEEPGRQFLYPPFSAMVFGLLGALPFQVAAVAHSVVNAVSLVLTLYLTRQLCRQHGMALQRGWLVVAGVLTIPYYLGNLQLLQMNLVLTVLVLAGLYAYARQQDGWAGALLAAATAFKVTPAIWFGWLLVRGRWRALGYAVAVLLLLVAVPWLVRGPVAGWADVLAFYQMLQAKIPTVSEVSAATNNKSLTGLLLNLQWLTGNSLPAVLLQLAPLLLGLGFMGWLIRLRRQEHPVTIREWAVTLLVTLLASTVTRTAHMVPLVLVFYALLAAQLNRRRGFVLGVGGLMLLTGRDIVGDTAYEFLTYTVNLQTLGLIALLILAITSERRNGQAAGS